MSIARVLLVLGILAAVPSFGSAQDKAPFTVVVMDPLALPLSCPCVKGYAQRDYDQLGKHLEKHLGRPVTVVFSESLTSALEKKTGGKADLIIGKESVIRHEARAANLKTTPIASLTGKDGKTTMTGLFVVAAADPALGVSDLKDYKLIFGPADSDEKHVAALKLLHAFEVVAPKKLDTCSACSDGALRILELNKEGVKAATVISSYAQPLLEGCGTIKKGDLRIIGETEPVPFVVAFINDTVPAAERTALEKALFQVGADAAMRTALETRNGFVPFEAGKKK